MILTATQLKQALPYTSQAKAVLYVPFINETIHRFGINKVDWFLAQLAHESGSFKYVEELASGKAYEGRKDLGNTQPGDGVKFKGRGLIQITGRSNYSSLSKHLSVDFVSNPELLEQPQYAALSAGWFWWSNKCDKAIDFKACTKIINGGYNGLADRLKCLESVNKALTRVNA